MAASFLFLSLSLSLSLSRALGRWPWRSLRCREYGHCCRLQVARCCLRCPNGIFGQRSGERGTCCCCCCCRCYLTLDFLSLMKCGYKCNFTFFKKHFICRRQARERSYGAQTQFPAQTCRTWRAAVCVLLWKPCMCLCALCIGAAAATVAHPQTRLGTSACLHLVEISVCTEMNTICLTSRCWKYTVLHVLELTVPQPHGQPKMHYPLSFSPSRQIHSPNSTPPVCFFPTFCCFCSLLHVFSVSHTAYG